MKNKDNIAGILLISLGILILISLINYNPLEHIPTKENEVQHNMGIVGFWVSYYLIKKTIGYAAFIFPLLMLMWGLNFITKKFKHLFKMSLHFLTFSLFVSIISAIISLPRDIPNEQLVQVLSKEPWGMIGGVTVHTLFLYFGSVGTYIIFFTIVAIAVLNLIDINIASIFSPFQKLASNMTFIPFSKKKNILASGKRKVVVGHRPQELENEAPLEKDFRPNINKNTEMEFEVVDEDVEIEEKIIPKIDDVNIITPPTYYKVPQPSSTLDTSQVKDEVVSWDEFNLSAKTLEEKLADFGIKGKVVEINPGPVITRFEIEPAPGVKVNRFTSLADDLALVMRAKRIRVVAPIPGKAAIGIEIPNMNPAIVYLKDVIDSKKFKAAKSPLTLALGMTIGGNVFVTDLRSMPHLLIAGSTGSGKSVCLHSMIASILFKSKPSDVQIVMIDPKRLELAPYTALKDHHLTYRDDLGEEVATTASNAILVLKSLEYEMEKRYELLAKIGVRNIEDYNEWLKSPEAKDADNAIKIPYIVLIIDELADLMMTAAREVEEPIARLTQMSRAVGIHLIVATQRPSVDVITGVIKANFPARIAFQVTTKTDSRTILDMNGAEKLLGKGDMLFLPPGSPEPIRIHNAFISHEEVKRLIEHVRQQPVPEVKTKLIIDKESDTTSPGRNNRNERDELFTEALKLVVRHQQGSSSLLQRRLKIGYTRAARIIDQLEEAGYVGPFDGSKAREVLVDDEELKEMGVI